MILAAALAATLLAPLGSPTALGLFESTYASVTSYSARVTFMERSGTEVQNAVLDYTFSKPSRTSIHFLSGKNAGVTLDWDGGSTVVAHRGKGLLGLFKRSYDLRDPAMKTIRGDIRSTS